MKVNLILLPTMLSLFMRAVVCTEVTALNNDTAWPIVYHNDARIPLSTKIEVYNQDFIDEELTPNARFVRRYNSEIYERLNFYFKLSGTVQCRISTDKWDCEACKALLPDGVVVRSFFTYPVGIYGYIVVSEKEKNIHVVIRGASSIRNQLLAFQADLVPHPRIPGAKVQKGCLQAMNDIRDILHNTITDQMLLHPDYAVYVTGHSYGAAIGSLVMVDLYQNHSQLNSTNLIGHLLGKPRVGDYAYAKYIRDENIQIRRIVKERDSVTHYPDIKHGFVHEGDEYWLRSEKDKDILFCPGPYETRNCSNSLIKGNYPDHLNYFVDEGSCTSLVYNIL